MPRLRLQEKFWIVLGLIFLVPDPMFAQNLPQRVNRFHKREKVMVPGFFLKGFGKVKIEKKEVIKQEKREEKMAQAFFEGKFQKTFQGPQELFTGEVYVEMLFPSNETAHYSGAYVTFQPGARTAWHLHPAGQHMILISGVGLTGTRDGKVIRFKAGDTIWCPPNIEHWHGATPDSSMKHLVITGDLKGQNVIWKEKVTEELYQASCASCQSKETKNPEMERERAIIRISSFATKGDIHSLKSAFSEGLQAGLTVNEIKEILVHLYAYTGFPRSLNALSTFMQVLEERESLGITDSQGKDATPISSSFNKEEYGAKVRAKLAGLETIPPPAKWQEFSPIVDTFLKEHLFADLFARDVLTHQERELTTIAALASMSGTEGQLRFHLMAAMNVGLDELKMKEFMKNIEDLVTPSEARKIQELVQEVLKERK